MLNILRLRNVLRLILKIYSMHLGKWDFVFNDSFLEKSEVRQNTKIVTLKLILQHQGNQDTKDLLDYTNQDAFSDKY